MSLLLDSCLDRLEVIELTRTLRLAVGGDERLETLKIGRMMMKKNWKCMWRAELSFCLLFLGLLGCWFFASLSAEKCDPHRQRRYCLSC